MLVFNCLKTHETLAKFYKTKLSY